MKLNELKVTLAKQILESENMDELHIVDGLLNPTRHFKLTATQKAELDRDFAKYKAGKGKSYTPEQVRARALKAIEKKKKKK